MSAATKTPRKAVTSKKTPTRPQSDLAADFARGRDHAIAMMEEAQALGQERDLWREYRKGEAQDNVVEGYLRDVIEDPTLRPGFTAILSGVILNGELNLVEVAKVTLTETQAGPIGEDGTALAAETSSRGPIDEVVDTLDSAAVVLDELLSTLDKTAAYGAQTLLVVAQEALGRAAAAQTCDAHEAASCAIGEAGAVLRCVADQLHSTALRGVAMLVDLAKAKHDAIVDAMLSAAHGIAS